VSGSSQSAILERIRGVHAAVETRLPGGEPWRRRRAESLARLLAKGLPVARDEAWRYADLRRIVDAAAREPTATAHLPAAGLPKGGLRHDDGPELVLLDGVPQPVTGAALPAGLKVAALAGTLDDSGTELAQRLRVPGDDAPDRLALLADAYTANGVEIQAEGGPAAPATMHLLHLATPGAVSHTRVRIELAAGADLTLIEHRPGAGGKGGLANLVVDLHIGRGATLRHLRILEGDVDDCRVDTVTVQLDAASRYEHHHFELGGTACRTGLTVDLTGTAATAEVHGLVLVDGGRRADLDAHIRHLAPSTTSRHIVRGVGAGPGQAAVSSRVFVAPGAQRSDSRQSLRNLLLASGAEIDVRPQLEINADDVRCSHGATTGSLDPAQLFYLLSRGIDRPAAQALLTFAFCEDVLANLGDVRLRRALEERVIARLPDRDVIREFI
jgi:Fe-S cluster assembly protein SufD